MFVVNASGKRGEGEEMILINPEIQRPKGNETAQEGCLSLPGVFGQVKRPKKIRISAYDITGNPIEAEVDGFLARVLQHENDHLDGLMFFDRMSEGAKKELEDQLDVFETDFRSQQSTGAIPSDDELIKRLSHWTEKYA